MWEHWLGLIQRYLSYEEAKKIVHKLNLNNQNEWRRYIKGEL